MVSIARFRKLALDFPNVEEAPHFERRAFKAAGRRIFTTLHEPSKTVNVMLSPTEQAAFCKYDKENIYPVPNKWGEKGVTTFVLGRVNEDVLLEAMHSAYEATLAPKKSK